MTGDSWTFTLPFRMFVKQALTEPQVVAVMRRHVPEVLAWLVDNAPHEFQWQEEYLRNGRPYIAYFYVTFPDKAKAALFKLFWGEWLDSDPEFLQFDA